MNKVSTRFGEKKESGLTKCRKCKNEYSMGRAIKDKDGMSIAWAYDKSCPECGTVNDDGIRVTFNN